MIRCNVLMLVAGAVLIAGSTSSASAQDTTKAKPHSQVRIPIGKERPAQAETLTVTRTDTVQLPGRVDTVTKTVTNTVTRVDTLMTPIVIHQPGSLYAGLAVGPSFAAPLFSESDYPGWRVEVPFGIDPVGSPFGVRFNLGYSRYKPYGYLSNTLSDATVMNADADLKLRILSATPFNTRVQVYGIGGLTYDRFQNILERDKGVYYIGNNSGTSIPAADDSWHNGLGWNAGGGAEIGKGNTNLFIETRFVRFSGVATNISYVPIVVGITIY